MLFGLGACADDGDDDPTDPTLGGSSSGGAEDDDDDDGPTDTTDDPSADSSTDPTMPDPDSSSGPGSESSSDDDGNFAECGDGIISGNEDCDCGGLGCATEDLGGATCPDVVDPTLPGPITGGVLGCNPASCRFDTSKCTYCGDRILDTASGLEVCEPGMDIDPSVTCFGLGAGTAGVVGCGADCQYDTDMCTDCGLELVFDEDECGLDGFTADTLEDTAGASSWECGEPSNYAGGPGVGTDGMWGTNLSGAYNANEISALSSPTLDFTTCTDPALTLTINHWHNFEGGAANADGGIVQARTGGDTWTTLVPIDGAPYSVADLSATYTPVDGTPGFSGTIDEQEWNESSFDMSQFVGEDDVQVRLVFGSDGANNQGGWYVTDFRIAAGAPL